MNKNIIISTYENDKLLFKNTTTALLEDNFLTYHTDNDTILINLETFSFTKSNNDTIFKLTNTNCTLKLLELNKTFDIPLKYLNFVHNINGIIIEYFLESQEYPLKIEIIIGSDI